MLDSPLLFHRFFFGKNKVMVVALGKGQTDEYKDNLHKVGEILCIYVKLENIILYLQRLTFVLCRSANIYEEKWEYYSLTKQRMRYKSK